MADEPPPATKAAAVTPAEADGPTPVETPADVVPDLAALSLTDRVRGSVKWFNVSKGFGFITPDDEALGDIFVHQSAVCADGFRSLREGEPVEFSVDAAGADGRVKAVHVTGPGGVAPQGAARRPLDPPPHPGMHPMAAHHAAMMAAGPYGGGGHPGAPYGFDPLAPPPPPYGPYGYALAMPYGMPPPYLRGGGPRGPPPPGPPHPPHPAASLAMGMPVAVGVPGGPPPPPRPPRPPPGTPGVSSGVQVVVHNLPWTTTWQCLKDAFASCDGVERADVILDGAGRSRGFGTVRLSTAAGAKAAVDAMNGADVGGRTITVRIDRYA